MERKIVFNNSSINLSKGPSVDSKSGVLQSHQESIWGTHITGQGLVVTFIWKENMGLLPGACHAISVHPAMEKA